MRTFRHSRVLLMGTAALYVVLVVVLVVLTGLSDRWGLSVDAFPYMFVSACGWVAYHVEERRQAGARHPLRDLMGAVGREGHLPLACRSAASVMPLLALGRTVMGVPPNVVAFAWVCAIYAVGVATFFLIADESAFRTRAIAASVVLANVVAICQGSFGAG